jgi:hypothetical protein
MTTRFEKLLSLAVQHDYYASACDDVAFVIPESTARIMRGAGLVSKVLGGALSVFFRADAEGAPARPLPRSPLRIGLAASSSFFANITEGFELAAGVLHYANRARGDALDPPARVTLVGDADLSRQSVFGIVEIRVDDSFHRSAPEFNVALRARRETLRYYVVARGFSNGDIGQLTVSDRAPAGSAVAFAPVEAADLSAEEKRQLDLLAADGSPALLFRSASAVARHQMGRKRIQLLRNDEALIENLPQPGRERATADVIVHLSKSKA